jgi:hypothetical protein
MITLQSEYTRVIKGDSKMGMYIPLLSVAFLFVAGVVALLVWRARTNKIESKGWAKRTAARNVEIAKAEAEAAQLDK